MAWDRPSIPLARDIFKLTDYRPFHAGGSSVFGTGDTDPDHERVYVALRDTADEPDVERTRALLHLMLTKRE